MERKDNTCMPEFEGAGRSTDQNYGVDTGLENPQTQSNGEVYTSSTVANFMGRRHYRKNADDSYQLKVVPESIF